MTIADSSAILDSSRVLPQHQAAVTLLQTRLAPPGSTQHWLDLACGRGQMVQVLEDALTAEARGRLSFLGVDMDQRHAREAVKLAQNLGLANADMRVGDLSKLGDLLPPDVTVDFMTLTNTVHEISPAKLPAVIVGGLRKLSPGGAFYISDMETIRPLELGAVAWTSEEMTRIFERCAKEFGAAAYRPIAQRWQHTTTASWSAIVDRALFDVEPIEFEKRAQSVVDALTGEIEALIRSKLEACKTALETLTMYGSETSEEAEEKSSYAYDFWALTRALEEFT